MKQIADDFRNASLKFDTLAELAGKESLRTEDRDAILFALKAVHFAIHPDTMWQFNEFLLNWPRELRAEEEERIREINGEIAQMEASDLPPIGAEPPHSIPANPRKGKRKHR